MFAEVKSGVRLTSIKSGRYMIEKVQGKSGGARIIRMVERKDVRADEERIFKEENRGKIERTMNSIKLVLKVDKESEIEEAVSVFKRSGVESNRIEIRQDIKKVRVVAELNMTQYDRFKWMNIRKFRHCFEI